MKNILITLALLFNLSLFAQDSHWNLQPEQELTLNYNLLGRSYAQGMLYGSGGYALGYLLSNKRTGWAIAGSILMVNIPIMFESKYKEPEIWIGKNFGALMVSAGFTITIEYKRKGQMAWDIHPLLRR